MFYTVARNTCIVMFYVFFIINNNSGIMRSPKFFVYRKKVNILDNICSRITLTNKHAHACNLRYEDNTTLIAFERTTQEKQQPVDFTRGIAHMKPRVERAHNSQK